MAGGFSKATASVLERFLAEIVLRDRPEDGAESGQDGVLEDPAAGIDVATLVQRVGDGASAERETVADLLEDMAARWRALSAWSSRCAGFEAARAVAAATFAAGIRELPSHPWAPLFEADLEAARQAVANTVDAKLVNRLLVVLKHVASQVSASRLFLRKEEWKEQGKLCAEGAGAIREDIERIDAEAATGGAGVAAAEVAAVARRAREIGERTRRALTAAGRGDSRPAGEIGEMLGELEDFVAIDPGVRELPLAHLNLSVARAARALEPEAWRPGSWRILPEFAVAGAIACRWTLDLCAGTGADQTADNYRIAGWLLREAAIAGAEARDRVGDDAGGDADIPEAEALRRIAADLEGSAPGRPRGCRFEIFPPATSAPEDGPKNGTEAETVDEPAAPSLGGDPERRSSKPQVDSSVEAPAEVPFDLPADDPPAAPASNGTEGADAPAADLLDEDPFVPSRDADESWKAWWPADDVTVGPTEVPADPPEGRVVGEPVGEPADTPSEATPKPCGGDRAPTRIELNYLRAVARACAELPRTPELELVTDLLRGGRGTRFAGAETMRLIIDHLDAIGRRGLADVGRRLFGFEG